MKPRTMRARRQCWAAAAGATDSPPPCLHTRSGRSRPPLPLVASACAGPPWPRPRALASPWASASPGSSRGGGLPLASAVPPPTPAAGFMPPPRAPRRTSYHSWWWATGAAVGHSIRRPWRAPWGRAAPCPDLTLWCPWATTFTRADSTPWTIPSLRSPSRTSTPTPAYRSPGTLCWATTTTVIAATMTPRARWRARWRRTLRGRHGSSWTRHCDAETGGGALAAASTCAPRRMPTCSSWTQLPSSQVMLTRRGSPRSPRERRRRTRRWGHTRWARRSTPPTRSGSLCSATIPCEATGSGPTSRTCATRWSSLP
mmetsp:Transcript_17548/g.43483  ORF Transcript_17548/g.43483 Transcript_17548/m.43483 type:complete len:314 (+) Transcript_17548:101-1042(+)